MAGYRTEEEERGASMESATPVPSPQNRRRMGRGVRKRKRDEGEYGEGGEEDESGNEDGDKYSGYGDSDSDRDAEGEWDDVGDEETEKPAKNVCIHCNADEDNDPNPEYEELLECTCGSFSHRQCDRTANDSGGVKSLYDEASGQWRCPSCAGADLQASPSTRSQSRNKEPLADENSPRKNLRKRKSDELDEDDGSVSARQMKREKTTNEPFRLNGNASLVENLEEDEDAPGEPDPEALESFEIPRPSSRSSQKPESSQRPISVTYKRTPRKFTLSLTNFTPQKLAPILAASPDPEAIEPKPTHRAGLRGSADPPSLSNAELPSSTIPASYAMSIDDEKNPPYGGILNETEADTSQTLPDTRDRERFDKARELAEEERATRLQLSMLSTGEKKSSAEKTAGASKIECIHFGEYEIDTWYAAPYPEEYSRNRVLWICEFCLKYMNSEYVGWRHKMKCDAKHPPGDEVYRDGSISVFEIDGRKNPIYCQNLCLLAKLFLGSKTLYYDVEPFLFYVMTECDDKGMHFVGYFSKEKRSTSQNNLSCILTLPIHQRKGYGNLLMDFSYLLTRCEKKTGSPEKPFSDLGLVSYRNYWKLKLCYQLRNQREPLSIANISERTGMTADDIVCGLEALHALIRDPVTGTYALRLDYRAFEAEIEKWEQKGYIKLNPDALTWTPFVLGRSQAEHFNDAPPLTTIAPRPGEDEAAKNAVSIDDGLEIEADDPGAAKDLNGITDSGAVDVDMLQSASQALEDDERARGSGSHSMESISIHKTATSGLMLGSDLSTTKKRPSPRSLKSQSPFQTINTNNNNLIPPTRFEIVPPLPGTSKKTRAGSSSAAARGRKRTSMSPATPRGNPLENSRSTTTTVRRARTKLSDTVTVNTGSSATRVTRGLSANLVDEVGGERSQRTASPAAESGIHPGTGRFVTSEV